MHAGTAHALDHCNAARQLTLQRAHLIILLHKIRHAHGVFIIKQLPTHIAGLGQAATGKRHPQAINLFARHHNAGATGTGFEGNLLLLQHRNDFSGGLGIHVAIQQGKIRFAGEKHHHRQRACDEQAGGGHGYLLVHAKLLPDGQELHRHCFYFIHYSVLFGFAKLGSLNLHAH